MSVLVLLTVASRVTLCNVVWDSGKRLYRVQTNGKGILRMHLPGGRYEVWGISQVRDYHLVLIRNRNCNR